MTFPFDAWLRAGVSALGLSPEQVWATSLRDLRALATSDASPLSRADLDTLCKLFPDGDQNG